MAIVRYQSGNHLLDDVYTHEAHPCAPECMDIVQSHLRYTGPPGHCPVAVWLGPLDRLLDAYFAERAKQDPVIVAPTDHPETRRWAYLWPRTVQLVDSPDAPWDILFADAQPNDWPDRLADDPLKVVFCTRITPNTLMRAGARVHTVRSFDAPQRWYFLPDDAFIYAQDPTLHPRNADPCPVCLDTLATAVALAPCRHALCPACLSKVRQCPMCRAPIEYTGQFQETQPERALVRRVLDTMPAHMTPDAVPDCPLIPARCSRASRAEPLPGLWLASAWRPFTRRPRRWAAIVHPHHLVNTSADVVFIARGKPE